MDTLSAPLQILLPVLSVPVLTAAISWLARRFTKESRLTIRVDRLAGIYTALPEGSPREEFGKRLNEATRELNARLNPLFKRQRRRKWKVSCWIISVGTFLAVLPGRALFGEGVTSRAGVLIGILCVVAFLLIERDTHKQRESIAGQEAAL